MFSTRVEKTQDDYIREYRKDQHVIRALNHLPPLEIDLTNTQAREKLMSELFEEIRHRLREIKRTRREHQEFIDLMGPVNRARAMILKIDEARKEQIPITPPPKTASYGPPGAPVKAYVQRSHRASRVPDTVAKTLFEEQGPSKAEIAEIAKYIGTAIAHFETYKVQMKDQQEYVLKELEQIEKEKEFLDEAEDLKMSRKIAEGDMRKICYEIEKIKGRHGKEEEFKRLKKYMDDKETELKQIEMLLEEIEEIEGMKDD